jgi:hypothetical protein
VTAITLPARSPTDTFLERAAKLEAVRIIPLIGFLETASLHSETLHKKTSRGFTVTARTWNVDVSFRITTGIQENNN